MANLNSISAVKNAINGGNFFGNRDVTVEHNGSIYIYKGIYVSVTYNYGYMQMEISIAWDEDTSQPYYKDLDLHMGYNTNFQNFQNSGSTLIWHDGNNRILITF